MSTSIKPDVSIVIPVYFNEGNLESTLSEIRKTVIDTNPDGPTSGPGIRMVHGIFHTTLPDLCQSLSQFQSF